MHKPGVCAVTNDKITLTVDAHTDLWVRDNIGRLDDNAPAYLFSTEEAFTFTVKTEYNGAHLYDQAGVLVYVDNRNWVKCATEFSNADVSWLGSVVAHDGHADWATADIDSRIQTMWYRLSCKKGLFQLDASQDGKTFAMMRTFYLPAAEGHIRFGVFACSPGDVGVSATFSELSMSAPIPEFDS